MAEQVLVLGVGNILFSDEAIGVRTVEHLQQCASLPGNVELMDGGTLGIRLMDAIMGCDLLIVVDAVLGGGEPGTLYRLAVSYTHLDARRSVLHARQDRRARHRNRRHRQEDRRDVAGIQGKRGFRRQEDLSLIHISTKSRACRW